MDLEAARNVLLEKQKEIASRVEKTHKHIYQKEAPVSADFSEQVTEMENEEIVHALNDEGRAELKLIQQALNRIESGDYPYCTICGEAIGEERLRAIPYTDKCIDCASKQQ